MTTDNRRFSDWSAENVDCTSAECVRAVDDRRASMTEEEYRRSAEHKEYLATYKIFGLLQYGAKEDRMLVLNRTFGDGCDDWFYVDADHDPIVVRSGDLPKLNTLPKGTRLILVPRKR